MTQIDDIPSHVLARILDSLCGVWPSDGPVTATSRAFRGAFDVGEAVLRSVRKTGDSALAMRAYHHGVAPERILAAMKSYMATSDPPSSPAPAACSIDDAVGHAMEQDDAKLLQFLLDMPCRRRPLQYPPPRTNCMLCNHPDGDLETSRLLFRAARDGKAAVVSHLLAGVTSHEVVECALGDASDADEAAVAVVRLLLSWPLWPEDILLDVVFLTLVTACQTGAEHIVRCIMELPDRPPPTHATLETAAETAAEHGHESIARLLLER